MTKAEKEAELARDLERAHAAVVDAALAFTTRIGKVKGTLPAEIKVPGYMYADLADAVQEWKDAGEALVRSQRASA
jgi:hypothetical protein